VVVEMVTLFKGNYALQREILIQNQRSENLWRRLSTHDIKQDSTIESTAENQINKFETFKNAFYNMLCLYLERNLVVIPSEFHAQASRKRVRASVAGFFYAIDLIANICFIIAQGAAISCGIVAARALLFSMIIILILEYIQLFVWLKTYPKVGRFISSVVNIFKRDVIGFAVVFVIIQLVFSICFLLLAQEEDAIGEWWRTFFIFYELSVGTGSWFKDKFDGIQIDSGYQDVDFIMDPYRRLLLHLLYMIHIGITVVILMNLLIAVMSETSVSVAEDMIWWEQNLKLSSVSLVSRRLRAVISIVRFFGIRGVCCFKMNDSFTIGGQTGTDADIIDGRLKLPSSESNTVEQNSKGDITGYYADMRWSFVLEHEALDVDKNGIKQKPKPRPGLEIDHEGFDVDRNCIKIQKPKSCRCFKDVTYPLSMRRSVSVPMKPCLGLEIDQEGIDVDSNCIKIQKPKSCRGFEDVTYPLSLRRSVSSPIVVS